MIASSWPDLVHDLTSSKLFPSMFHYLVPSRPFRPLNCVRCKPPLSLLCIFSRCPCCNRKLFQNRTEQKKSSGRKTICKNTYKSWQACSGQVFRWAPLVGGIAYFQRGPFHSCHITMNHGTLLSHTDGKHLQFIAHLPTKYHPIPDQKGASLMELAAGEVPSDPERVARMNWAVGVTLQHVSLHIWWIYCSLEFFAHSAAVAISSSTHPNFQKRAQEGQKNFDSGATSNRRRDCTFMVW